VRAVSDEKDPQDTPEETLTPSEEAEASEPEAAPSERPVRRAKSGTRKAREGRAPAAPPPAPTGIFVVIGLAAACVGAAGGWFGHEAQAKAKLRAESVPAASGSAAPAGPCGAWQQKICAGSGDTSSACAQAKSATDLLTPSTCTVALESVPATLAKVKAARASCDSLVAKLCADLPQGSNTCAMVRERTPAFPPERCSGMLTHYDEVITELRQMDQQGGPQMQMGPGHGGPGMPPGAQGMPPGAPGMPQGAPGAAR